MDTRDKTLILMGLILAVLVCLVIILRSKMQRVPVNQTAMFENTERVVARPVLLGKPVEQNTEFNTQQPNRTFQRPYRNSGASGDR